MPPVFRLGAQLIQLGLRGSVNDPRRTQDVEASRATDLSGARPASDANGVSGQVMLL